MQFKKMSFLLVIPARYSSKRLPGKPLKKINGKEMISHVWEKCIRAVGEKNVLIATDSKKIYNFCNLNSYNTLMTSDKCLTGTDRLYEVSKPLFIGHGDLCFNNILVDPNSGSLKLIDPKAYPDKSKNIVGLVDPFYDLAKLNHSFTSVCLRI